MSFLVWCLPPKKSKYGGGNLNTIFSNVNLNRIDFLGGRPDVKFEFIDPIHGSNKYSGEIVCKHILVFKMDTSFEIEEDFPFPCFLCDVKSINLKKIILNV